MTGGIPELLCRSPSSGVDLNQDFSRLRFRYGTCYRLKVQLVCKLHCFHLWHCSYRVAIRESRIPVFANKLVSTIRVGGLATNGFFDGGSRKAAWRSSILLPLLQRPLRDL